MRTKLIVAVLLAALALFAVPSFAQYQLPQGYELMHRNAGRFNASVYGLYTAKIISGNASTGASSIIVGTPTALPDGYILPIQAAFNPASPFYIQDAAAEIPTAITAVAYGACPTGAVGIIGQNCATISATFASLHGAGATITSGTYGLMEAVADAWLQGGGIVSIGREFQFPTLNQLPTGTTLVNPFGLSNVYIEDARASGLTYWSPYPGLTGIAVPTALTTASTLTTSTTGGTIATGTTPRFCVTAEDVFGGESPCSADAAGTATLVDGATSTNSYTITAAGVPVGTGIVGYRLYVTASGGATQTETLALPAQLSCTAAPQAPLTGSCAPGFPITLTALTATTQAGPPPGTSGAATAMATAHTTTGLRQTGFPPQMLPFVDTAIAGFYPVTVTSATTLAQGQDEMGELAYPANFFNSAGSVYRICGGGVTTPSAATVAGTWTIAIGPRVSSAGFSATTQRVVVPWGMVASMQWTAALSNFDFCADVQVVTTATGGTAATMEGHATTFCGGVLAAGNGTGTDNCINSFAATSSSIDTTQQGVISLTYLQTAASWTLPQLRYFTVKRL